MPPRPMRRAARLRRKDTVACPDCLCVVCLHKGAPTAPQPFTPLRGTAMPFGGGALPKVSGPRGDDLGHRPWTSPHPFAMLSSVCRISLASGQDYLSPQLFEEGRGWQLKVKFEGMLLKPWIVVQKTAEGRRRTRTSNPMAKIYCLQHGDHPETKKELWRIICWRTATVIVCCRRIATLERRPDECERNLQDDTKNSTATVS